MESELVPKTPHEQPDRNRQVILSANSSEFQQLNQIDRLYAQINKLKQRTENSARDIESATKDIELTKNITYLGFFILLVMVATLLVMVIGMVIDASREKTDAFNRLSEQVEGYRQELAMPSK